MLRSSRVRSRHLDLIRPTGTTRAASPRSKPEDAPWPTDAPKRSPRCVPGWRLRPAADATRPSRRPASTWTRCRGLCSQVAEAQQAVTAVVTAQAALDRADPKMGAGQVKAPQRPDVAALAAAVDNGADLLHVEQVRRTGFTEGGDFGSRLPERAWEPPIRPVQRVAGR